MSFVAPFFLYALAAIAIPILIHLFDLQRPKKVFFTNVRLLKNINEQTSSTRKLKNLWILLCRILAISFLVLAFAQPFFKGKDNHTIAGSQSVGVYIDNSMSMQNSDGQKPLLELARKTAEKLTEILMPATQYYYLDNQFLPKDSKTLTSETFKDRLTETNLASSSRTFENVWQKQNNTLENTASKAKKLFWLSDFQKSTAGNLSALKLDSSVTLYLVPFQNQEVSNVYIDSVWLENVFVKQNEPNNLKVKLKNSGKKNSSNLHLKLILDEVQSGMATVEIKANSEAITSFDFNVNDKKLKKGVINFEDNPVAFDNTYFFTVNVAPSINILLITDNTNSYISKVYANEDVFKLQLQNPANVGLNRLEGAQLIVAEGFDNYSKNTLELLKSQHEKGKTILLIPAEKPSVTNLALVSAIFGLPLLQINQQPSNEKSSIDDLKMPDLKNPFYANIFESSDKNMSVPYAVPLIKWGNKGQNLLETKRDEAFISVFQKPKGKILICSTPLIPKYTNFQKHSFFVPVMYKLATQSASANKHLAYNFDHKSISVPTPNSNPKGKIKLSKGDFSYIPEQNIKSNLIIFNIPQENAGAGFYDLFSGDSLLTAIALNIPSAESKLDNYTSAELKTIFEGRKNVILYQNAINDAFVNDFKAANIGIPLWKYCLLLALFFLLSEALLIRFIKN